MPATQVPASIRLHNFTDSQYTLSTNVEPIPVENRSQTSARSIYTNVLGGPSG